MAGKPRLLFVVTEDWYFASHRFELARAAREAGFEVGLATRLSTWQERIEAAGIRVFPLRFMRRSSRDLVVELRAVGELKALLREWRPDLLHLVAAKPVIYGGLAARWAGVPRVIGALAGLGHAFASDRASARVLRRALLVAYRAALKHPNARLIVQNPEDEHLVIQQRLVSGSAVRMICGSGVDTGRFVPHEEPNGEPTFVLAARMLWDKGVGDFVAAARELRQRNVAARFVLVGDADSENPAAIPRAQLLRWQEEGHVDWWGHRSDMPSVLSTAHVACLPSYREGLPKSLLEAASSALPLVATDVPGCREIAVHEQTGLLVPPRDPASLADAMQRLAGDASLRRRLGAAGRQLVEARFSSHRINEQTVALYREMMDSCVSP